MNNKLLGTALFILTLGTIFYYPSLMARNIPVDLPIPQHITASKPKIDVVFVLDTTGSMSGLIEAAKEKIWSIATTMASAQSAPEIRIGLVGYRDRSDAYVTKVVDLSSDLDSVYATLMEFQAGGGGDTPESVNRALYDAVHEMSWSQGDDTYQVIFLVGDAPPHMDYNEVKYPQIIATALDKGIVINAIQCGDMPATLGPWQQIASLGQGSFFQVEQGGSAVAYTSPFDTDIAALSAKLDNTRLYYGSDEKKEKMAGKVAATDKMHAHATDATRARRAVFNSVASGRTNMLGENELVDAVLSGSVDLDALEADELPEALKPMAPEAQRSYVANLGKERAELQLKIRDLSESRDDYLARKVKEDGGARDSLDQKIFEAVKKQGGKFGFEYEDGPAY